MKKKINKPMRAAGALLVATMLTTCMTAGTFAKYTTTDSATDTARVAKFGVNITVNGSLYGREYSAPSGTPGNTPITYTGKTVSATGNVGTVQVYTASGAVPAAQNTSNVVAPGTKSDSGLGFKIDGTPEVDTLTTVNVEAKNIYLKQAKYGMMKVVKFNNLDELRKAWESYGGDATSTKLFTLSSSTYTPVADLPTSYNNAIVYCKLTDRADTTDFVKTDGTGSINYYFPVVYSLEKGKYNGTDTTLYSVEYNSGTPESDSLSTVLTTLNGIHSNATTNAGPIATTTGWTTLTWTSSTMQANYDFNSVAPNEILNWEWKYEYNDTVKSKYDKLDTILGDLVAQNTSVTPQDATNNNFQKTMDNNNEGACRIVKQNNAITNTYIEPVEAVTGTASATGHLTPITTSNDYNLYTGVYLDVTVTQVD